MKINKQISLKIKELRAIAGFSAEAVAKDLGISKGAYSQLENGKTEITLARVYALAEIFKIPIQEMLPKVGNDFLQNSTEDNAEKDQATGLFDKNDTAEKLQAIIDSLKDTQKQLIQ